MEPVKGFEPPADGLQNHCSTPELHRHLRFVKAVLTLDVTIIPSYKTLVNRYFSPLP